jgi:hypothetical protein
MENNLIIYYSSRHKVLSCLDFFSVLIDNDTLDFEFNPRKICDSKNWKTYYDFEYLCGNEDRIPLTEQESFGIRTSIECQDYEKSKEIITRVYTNYIDTRKSKDLASN